MTRLQAIDGSNEGKREKQDCAAVDERLRGSECAYSCSSFFPAESDSLVVAAAATFARLPDSLSQPVISHTHVLMLMHVKRRMMSM